MANTKARRAKKETIDKWERVQAKLREARIIMGETCAFCMFACLDCPALDICGMAAHSDALKSIYDACEDVQTLQDKIRGIKV